MKITVKTILFFTAFIYDISVNFKDMQRLVSVMDEIEVKSTFSEEEQDKIFYAVGYVAVDRSSLLPDNSSDFSYAG